MAGPSERSTSTNYRPAGVGWRQRDKLLRWFDPLASGHNPIATERLADLSFPNLVLGRSGVETLVDASSHGAKSDITSDANFLAALLEQL